MNTLDLIKALDSNLWHPHQANVIPVDKLNQLKIETYPFVVILNLDTSNQPGSHWTAIYSEDCPSKSCPADYFCSFATEIPVAVKKIFNECFGCDGVVKATVLPYQDPYSVSCGLWCLDFILNRSWGVTTEHYLFQFDAIDTRLNERILHSRWEGDIKNLRFKMD